jgi:hypothetical protein
METQKNAAASNPKSPQAMNNASAAASTLFLGQSGETWDLWVILSLVLAIAAALAVAFATTGSVVAHKREAAAAEQALGKYKLEAAGKVADAETAGIAAGTLAGNAQAAVDAAKVQIAQAKAKAAEADARAAEASLALEKFKAPRSLTPAQLDQLTEALSSYAGVPFDFSIQPSAETIDLMTQIGGALKKAGLRWEPNKTPVPFLQPGIPAAGIVAFSGFAVQYDTAKEAEWELPARAIWHALEGFGLKIRSTRIVDGKETPDAIHLYIGEKPH